MTGCWRIVAVDWSGARSEQAQRRKIWCCEAVEDDGRLCVRDLRAGATRDEIVAWLAEQLLGAGRLLVGLDFAFSLPRGFVARQLGQEGQTWDEVVDFCAENAEAILNGCPQPFWGGAGTRKPPPEDWTGFGLQSLWRETEGRIGTAKSVFQIGGAGAVGTGTLRGIPLLRVLQAAGFAIWPFDGPPREGQSVVVEIYPRLFSQGVRKSARQAREEHVAALCEDEALVVAPIVQGRAGANDDAFDAFVSAVGMWRELRGVGRGFEQFGMDFYVIPVVQSEGWIWGVGPY